MSPGMPGGPPQLPRCRTRRPADAAIREIARVAEEVNTNVDNIGARRLHTILERILEDVSFDAPEKARGGGGAGAGGPWDGRGGWGGVVGWGQALRSGRRRNQQQARPGAAAACCPAFPCSPHPPPSAPSAPSAPQAKQQGSQFNVVIDKEDVLAKVGQGGGLRVAGGLVPGALPLGTVCRVLAQPFLLFPVLLPICPALLPPCPDRLVTYSRSRCGVLLVGGGAVPSWPVLQHTPQSRCHRLATSCLRPGCILHLAPLHWKVTCTDHRLPRPHAAGPLALRALRRAAGAAVAGHCCTVACNTSMKGRHGWQAEIMA